jgi:hypothetical protein
MIEVGELDVPKEACMRAIALVSITLAMLCTSTIGARADGSWCANYGTGPGMNCGFYSYQQCMLRSRGLEELASPIHSQAPQGNRKSAIGAAIRRVMASARRVTPVIIRRHE